MRITGRMEKTGDKIYFLGRVIQRPARGYSVEANPKYNPKRDKCSWFGGSKTSDDSKCEEDANDRIAR